MLPSGGMYCECTDNFTGIICGIPPPPICNNNGYETSDGSCVCNSDFGGADCSVPALNCQNGGKFNQITTFCDCTTGWFGTLCETKDINFRGEESSSSLTKNYDFKMVTILIVYLMNIF